MYDNNETRCDGPRETLEGVLQGRRNQPVLQNGQTCPATSVLRERQDGSQFSAQLQVGRV